VFRFNTHPGAVTVTEGVQMAFDYLLATWRRWLPAVVAVAALSFAGSLIIYLVVGSTDFSGLYYVDRYTGRLAWSTGGQARLLALIPPLVALGIANVVAGIFSGWVFNAAAICGLRNRPLSVSFIVNRGLLSIASGILIVVVFVIVLVAVIVATALITLTVPLAGALLIIAEVLAVVPVVIYVEIRLVLTTLAVFDGFGPIEGIKESWRLSQGSVLRMFGWGLMAFLILIGFSIVSALVSAPLGVARVPALGSAGSSLVMTTGSCFTVFMMAVLYESQRARLDPSLYQFTPSPGYQAPYPGGSYPAPPYPAAPYSAGPYPYAPGPNPGWGNPNAPAWPGYPPPYPGTPPAWGANPADPSAGPAGQPDEPGQTSPGPGSATNPTDPPAAS
jgi:hypothetical protein